MSQIYDLDVSAGGNNAAPPHGAPENMQYSDVNDTLRELMALLARWAVAGFGGVTTGGSEPAYTLTSGQSLSAYADGQHFCFLAHATSTGAATLNVDTLGNVALRDSRGNQLGEGDIQQNGVYFVSKQGSSFRLIGHLAASSVQSLASNTLARAYTTGGTSNAYTVTTGLFTAQPDDGTLLAVLADRANTGAATLDVDGQGALAWEDIDSAALSANDIVTNQAMLLAKVSGEWRTVAGMPINLATQVVGLLPLANIVPLATQRVLGRNTADTGTMEAVTLTQLLDWIGSAAQGDLLYRGASAWARLAAGTSGQFLKTQGAGQNPQWADLPEAITFATPQATTSGTTKDFTGLPAGINRITIMFNGVDLSGSNDFLVQIGDSGGVETTGYSSSSFNRAADGNSTSGFIMFRNSSSSVSPMSGSMTLTRLTGNVWVSSHGLCELLEGVTCAGGGVKTLSATLDRVRIACTGADTFSAGQVNIMYE